MKGHKRTFAVAGLLHALIIFPLIFFVSHEGMLGKKMQTLSVALVPKTKIEEPKPKAESPKMEVPKTAVPIELPKPVAQSVATPPPSVASTVAPTAVDIPSFAFNDGAKDVISTSDPIELYKMYMQTYIKSQWSTPEGFDKVTDVYISLDAEGNILSTTFDQGNDKWDLSIASMFKRVKTFPKAPPKNFPLRFKIRFDMTEQL